MPDKIVMDEKLFAHILLDPELGGRHDVEGNQFETTFGYLNQYINIYFKEQKQAVPESLEKIRRGMASLLEFEKAIQIANGNIPNKLEQLNNTIVDAIKELNIGESLLIPGGWSNPSSPGHAMIYQFTQTRDGLQFSIYNSGAGIQYHEKISSTLNERYYPVRIHQIPQSYHPLELNALVNRLMLAQLPFRPRDHTTYNEEFLYQDIDTSLVYLDATQLLASELIPKELTTAGQLSGTCSQRVIHQMLKIAFGNLEDYQQFILQFKLHALREFTARDIHSMSEPVIELVRLAINNITKLLKQLDMTQIRTWLGELSTLKKLFHSRAVPETLAPQMIPDPNLEKPLTIKINHPSGNEDTGFRQLIPAHHYLPIIPLNPTEDLIPQLDALITTSNELKFKNPCFVIEQLEQAIVSLPLPPSFDRQKLADFKAWEAYIGTDENIKKMIGYLETLQGLYVCVCDTGYPSLRRPRQQIVHGILIGLRDFFHFQSQPVDSEPSHRHSKLLRDIFEACDHSPWISANDLLFDEKFDQLLALYRSDKRLPYTTFQNITAWYKTFITLEEDAALIKVYEAWHQSRVSKEFDVNLRKNRVISLYTLFEFFKLNGERNNDTLSKIKESLLPDQTSLNLLEQGILTTFSKQLALEQFFSTSMNSFSSNKKNYDAPRIYEQFSNELFSNELFFSQISPFTYGLSSKYTVQNSPEHTVLLQGIPLWRKIRRQQNEIHWSSNTIQLSAELAGVQKDPLFVRDLLHLRTSPSHQIQLTLDYFKQCIHTLEDPNTQTYVEANLFERNYLGHLLDNDQDALLLQFDGLIQRGSQFFLSSQALMTQTSIFFIHLRFLFNDYLAQKNPELAYHRLKQDLDELSALISLPHDEFILASLHQYRFLTGMKVHVLQNDGHELQAGFSEVFQSLFFIQKMSNPSRKDDADITVLVERAKYHFQDWLEKTPDEALRENIKLAMKANGIDSTHCTLEGAYPHFHLKNQDKHIGYDIDVSKGLIFKNNRASGMTPPDIKTHVITKRLGLDQESVCFMSPDQTIIELITDQQEVRITKSPTSQRHLRDHAFNYRIEKTWSLGGEGPQWHQLYPLNAQQNDRLKLGEFNESLLEHDLPKSLDVDSITVWVNNLDHSVLIVKEDKPIFQSNAQGELEQLDEQGRRNGYILSSYHGAFASVLANFEDSQNLVATRKDDQWQIHLPRYNLVLETEGTQLRLQGTDYTLTDKPSPFPSSVACLNLSHQGEHRVIVAVQPFHVDKKVSPERGGYYPLKHAVGETERTIWNYDSSVKYLSYKLIDGKPQPDKPADALYLCYLYLANHQHEKAWAVLDGILGLEGSYQELVFLEWIVNKLPMEQNKSIKNPVYLACQLKALAMLTDNLADDIKPVFPPEDNESTAQKEIRTFYQALPKTIGHMFHRFQNMERHLSHPYSLDNEARRSLLNTWQRLRLDDVNTIQIDNQFRFFGALGYQYRRLSLETLLKEKHALEAVKHTLQTSGKPLPKKFATRLNEIDVKLRTELPIMKKETKIETVTLPEKIKLDSYGYDRALTISATWTQQALDNLKSDLSEKEFFNHMGSYLYIALNQSITSSPCLALENFCIHCLRNCAHPSTSKDQKTLEDYAYCLYRLINAPDSIKEDIKKGIESANKPHSYDSFNDYNNFTLNKLFNKISSIQIRPIEIYQAQDVFQQTLAINEQILDELTTSFAHKKINLTPINGHNVYSMASFKDHLKKELPGFSVFEQQFNQAESVYQSAFQHHLNQLDQLNTTSEHRMQQEQLSEQSAGVLKFHCAQEQNAAATWFASEDTQARLKTLADAFQMDLNTATVDAWENARIFANQAPDNADSATLRALEKIAGLRHETLTQHELLKLYFNADEAAYFEMTGLSSDKINTLHNLVHQAVTQSLEAAHLQRLIKTLENAKPEDASNIAATLMSENLPEAQNDPCLMVFQHQENILLRPKQCLALKNLLTKTSDDQFKLNESVEKVIMGGGKSKVILPLIAQKKANGHHLVMVEVPRALLKTNHTDLNQTSRQLFDQKAHCFEFSRNSPCSPERLEDIYNHFKQSMVNKEYWVTTGESIQSLELKYLELLLSGQPLLNPEIWQQQIKWMGKITLLIRDFGDVIIDEMHQGLLLKKELNYSLGESESVNSTLRDLSVKLYRFIDLLSLQHQPQGTKPLLRAEAMRMAWTASLMSLIDDLLQHEQSPLKTIIDDLKEQYGNPVHDQLRAYLHDHQELPMMAQLDYATQDTLAFYKEQLSALLPHTLAQKHKVNYGPSDEKRCKNIANQVLAVPYVANSQPSERSDFGNLLTKVNYTIQSLLIDGLNEALLKEMITEWINKAKVELDNNPELLRIENTAMAIGVNHCLEGTGFQLQAINIKNDQQINDLLDKVQFKTDFIFNMLEHNLLEKISIEPDMLHSNALNHVDLYHSVQGLTGTPYNYTTYHQRTQFNRNTALGTDGYLLETLKHKQTDIHAIEFTQMDAFLPKLFSSLTHPKPRAIIDVGAMFTGITNVDVAKALARYWSKSVPVSGTAIKYILYFNTDNELSALNVINQHIITLTSSNPDEINQKLGCTPEERFTYYDQAHTVGADLKQSSDSTGVVLIDPKSQIQGFLQGAMRMRGLEANQTIEIVTPQAMANHSLQDLMDLMVENEQQQLSEDNFNAAIAKMENAVRNDLIEKIHALPEHAYAAKEHYADAFRRYFVQSKQGRLYDKYGHVATEQNTKNLLNDHKIRLLKDWETCINQLQPPVENANDSLLNRAMSFIITSALPYCQTTMKSRQQSFDQETETQLQKENQVLIEQNKELQKETHNQNKSPRLFNLWHKQDLSNFLNEQSNHTIFQSLNKQCDSETNLLFSPQLFVSDNHALTYSGQTKMLNPGLKPVHAILFAKVEHGIKACLMTNEELKNIAPFLDGPEFTNVWIGTTQHARLAGHRPEGILNDPSYKTLIEQTRFFNGEFALLNQQKEPFQWINIDCETKIEFFQNNLERYRPTKTCDIALLEAKLSKQLVGFRHLAAHRFQPLAIAWEKLFPGASRSDIKVLVSLAQAFDEANKNELDAPALDLDSLRRKHELPMETIGALKTHLAIHMGIKQLRHRLESKPSFEKLLSLKIFVMLDLMSVLSGVNKGGSPLRLDPSITPFFFKHLGKITGEEWHHLINSPEFDRINKALPCGELTSLCLNSIDTLNDTDWTSLIKKLDEPTRLELIQDERIDANKKAQLVEAACVTRHSHNSSSFSMKKYKQFVNAIPKAQLNETIPIILSRDIVSLDKEEEERLLYLAHKTDDPTLHKKILLSKNSVKLFLNTVINNMKKGNKRYTSGQDSLKIRALENLYNSFSGSGNQNKIKQLNPDYLLKTIQAICEQKRHSYNLLWEPQSVSEYKAWLSKYNASALYINNNPPMTPELLTRLAKNISHQSSGEDSLDVLLNWEPRSNQ